MRARGWTFKDWVYDYDLENENEIVYELPMFLR